MNSGFARCSSLLVFLALSVSTQAGSINKSVKVEAGTTSDGASSVNGSVTVGDGATVTGDVDTVNGTIRIGSSAIVERVSTVNGSLRVGENVQARQLETVNGKIRVAGGSEIAGGIEAVNGRISLENAVIVRGGVGNVNGQIDIDGASIERSVSTVNGDVTLDNGAHVMGDIVIESSRSWANMFKKQRVPKITLGKNVRVDGKIRTEREVEIYMHDSAELGGVVGEAAMEDVVRFSGNRP